jgi:hypothetical protein
MVLNLLYCWIGPRCYLFQAMVLACRIQDGHIQRICRRRRVVVNSLDEHQENVLN